MVHLSLVEVLLELTVAQEAQTRKLLYFAHSTDLDLISHLGLFVTRARFFFSSVQLFAEVESEVAYQRVEVV